MRKRSLEASEAHDDITPESECPGRLRTSIVGRPSSRTTTELVVSGDNRSREARLLLLQSAVGNQAVQRLLRVHSGIQRDPVRTVYGDYDSSVLEEQQHKVEAILGTLEAVEDELPTYGVSPGGFRTYTKLPTFPEERKTLKRPGRGQQHYQGWKLHVGVKPDEAGRLAEKILPIAQKYEVVHKVVGDLMVYATDKDVKQLGKYITIYPKNIDQLFEIVSDIESALLDLRLTPLGSGERTASEYPLGTSGLVTTRYGSFTGEEVYIPGRDDVKGTYVKDERSRTHPEGLEGEFQAIQEMNHDLVGAITTIRHRIRQAQQAKQEERRKRGKGGLWDPTQIPTM